MAPRSGFTPFTTPEVVAAYMQPVLERLGLSFSSACDRTKRTFGDRAWSDDAALAAYLIRKEVLEDLRADGMQVEDDDVEIERKALCGLLLTLPLVHLKIRKSKDGEIPAAGSRQSLSFYNWNLLVFPQAEEGEILPLHLLLLWNDNRKGELDTLLLVCVEGNDWHWRIPVFQRNPQARHSFAEPTSARSISVKSDVEPFTSAFDSANDDVPLKLAKVAPTSPTEQIETKTDAKNDQPEQKKKAQ
jgi:hypothetical protein